MAPSPARPKSSPVPIRRHTPSPSSSSSPYTSARQSISPVRLPDITHILSLIILSMVVLGMGTVPAIVDVWSYDEQNSSFST